MIFVMNITCTFVRAHDFTNSNWITIFLAHKNVVWVDLTKNITRMQDYIIIHEMNCNITTLPETFAAAVAGCGQICNKYLSTAIGCA
jgi:hypothetical protein